MRGLLGFGLGLAAAAPPQAQLVVSGNESEIGRRVLVQYHPDRAIDVFDVGGDRLRDSGERIPVPGMPSSIRSVQ